MDVKINQKNPVMGSFSFAIVQKGFGCICPILWDIFRKEV
jgi:hypothetical protein